MTQLSRDLTTFDRQLGLYGPFRSAPVFGKEMSQGRAAMRHCGPFHAVSISADNLASRRTDLNGPWRNKAILLLIESGVIHISKCGRQIDLAAGDVYVMDPRRPLEITAPHATRATCIAIDREGFEAHSTIAGSLFETKISGENGFPRLLGRLLLGLLEDRHNYDLGERASVTSAVCSMVAHSAGDLSSGGRIASDSADLLETIKAWIRRNLGDADLDVSRIARQFALSRSSLFRLFATAGESPREWIARERLKHAYDALANPLRHRQNVSGICFGLGFNDTAHFSRLFKQTYGMTPSQVRAGARGSLAR